MCVCKLLYMISCSHICYSNKKKIWITCLFCICNIDLFTLGMGSANFNSLIMSQNHTRVQYSFSASAKKSPYPLYLLDQLCPIRSLSRCQQSFDTFRSQRPVIRLRFELFGVNNWWHPASDLIYPCLTYFLPPPGCNSRSNAHCRPSHLLLGREELRSTATVFRSVPQ